MKRTITITIIALIIIGIGIGIYLYFFRTPASPITVGGTLPTAGQSANTGNTNTGDNQLTGTQNNGVGSPSAIFDRLVKISDGPVVNGEIVLDIKPSKSATTTSTSTTSANTLGDTVVQYIERDSGNVFSYSTLDKKITRINNKTVPGIQSAEWLPNGSSAFVQYLSGSDFSTINTYSLQATSSAGFFLPQNLSDIAVSASKVLMLSSSQNGSTLSISNTDGTKPAEVGKTSLSSIRASFLGKNSYLVFTKPSAGLDGVAYLMNSSGRLSTIAGPSTGLVALASPSGDQVLISSFVNGAMQLRLVNVSNKESITLPVATIADKCVWANDSSAIYCGVPVGTSSAYSYPDDWYQGAVFFSDKIWKINVASRYAQLVLDFSKEQNGSLDAVNLAVNPSNTFLTFINKADGSLWGYSL